jgi:hypothetical protein
MNAKNLMECAWALYNSDWVVIKNDTGTDFLTSDNPFAFDDPGPWRGGLPRLPRYLPIAPDLCLLCDVGQAAQSESEPDFSQPPRGTVCVGTIPPRGVCLINRAIVQCAEDIVISPKELPSVEALVKKYGSYRVDVDFIEIQKPSSFTFGTQTRVRERLLS